MTGKFIFRESQIFLSCFLLSLQLLYLSLGSARKVGSPWRHGPAFIQKKLVHLLQITLLSVIIVLSLNVHKLLVNASDVVVY